MIPINHYQMQVRLDPATGAVAVEATMDWYAEEGGRTEIPFALHQSAKISEFASVPAAAWEIRSGEPVPFAPEAAVLMITLAAPLAAGQGIRLSLKYDLVLGVLQPWEVNRVTPEWVELGSYQPWFPLDVEYRPFGFSVRLEVAQPGYAVSGNGLVSREGGRWLIESELPDKDLIVMASQQLREVSAGRIRVIYAREDDAGVVQRVLDDSDWLLRYFTERFGEPMRERLTLAIAPRDKGGGYARHGFVVLTPDGLQKPLIAFRYMAHELAHLWWQRAETASWQDWLNESFAEYSSIIAVRERFGQAQAEELLAVRRERAAGMPAIMGLPRQHEQAYPTLYSKGCILLDRLEGALGRPAMMLMLREMNDQAVSTTDAFLRLLAEIGGQDVADQCAAWLRE